VARKKGHRQEDINAGRWELAWNAQKSEDKTSIGRATTHKIVNSRI
jgi:hypothetical protein